MSTNMPYKPKRPVEPPRPTQDDLNLPHQLVEVYNSHPQQVHIVFDRGKQAHQLAPGERRFISMTTHDINYFVGERDPNRIDAMGNPKPLHLICIIGFSSMPSEDERQALATAARRRA